MIRTKVALRDLQTRDDLDYCIPGDRVNVRIGEHSSRMVYVGCYRRDFRGKHGFLEVPCLPEGKHFYRETIELKVLESDARDLTVEEGEVVLDQMLTTSRKIRSGFPDFNRYQSLIRLFDEPEFKRTG